MTAMSKWEAVTEAGEEDIGTMRLTVPGGWIYRYGKEMIFVAFPPMPPLNYVNTPLWQPSNGTLP